MCICVYIYIYMYREREISHMIYTLSITTCTYAPIHCLQLRLPSGQPGVARPFRCSLLSLFGNSLYIPIRFGLLLSDNSIICYNILPDNSFLYPILSYLYSMLSDFFLSYIRADRGGPGRPII